MSPTAIVAGSRQLTQTKLMSVIPKKWLPQFQFGLKAYTLKPFQSAASNARSVVANPNTAARKSERLLANANLADQFGTIFDQLHLVRPNSYVNCDHSDVHGLTAFVGAVQTRNGRAIPCLVETTYSDRLPGIGSAHSTKHTDRLRCARTEERTHTSFTGHYIDALQTMADRLGFWPKLVFDRGFGNESLVTHLQSEGATFYIRFKGDRLVTPSGTATAVPTKQLPNTDETVRVYGLPLRVIRSPKSRRAKEPWYILTNDHASSRDKIVRIYYHRFEIEESFKDLKHLFEFDHARFSKPNSLKVLLWFIFLGMALLYVITKPTKQQQHNTNPKKRISWIRAAYEQLLQGYALLFWEPERVR